MATDRPRQLLIIDDSEDIRETYRELLEDQGYSVSTAANGEEGLALVRSSRPDVILVDVVMPVMDGLEFLLRLRSDFAPPLPFVIVCSGFQSMEQIVLRQGADAFLHKPVSIPMLLALISRALAGDAPDEALVSRERDRAAEARKRAVDAAQEAVANTPWAQLLASAHDLLAYLSGYFDADAAFAAVIRNDMLTVMDSHGQVHERPLSSPSTAIGEIISTGSTLVLADVAQHPAFARDLEHLPGCRSLVAVPSLAPSGVTVAAICLARHRIEPFVAEDVLILQAAGTRATRLLERIDAGAVDPFGGFPFIGSGAAVHRDLFQVMVEMELRVAASRGDAVGLALADVVAPITAAALQAAQHAVEPRRWAIGRVGSARLGFFKRAPEAARVARQIDAATDAFAALVPLDGVCSVAVAGDAVAAIDGPMLFRLASRQLAASEESGRLDRLVLGRAPQPAAVTR